MRILVVATLLLFWVEYLRVNFIVFSTAQSSTDLNLKNGDERRVDNIFLLGSIKCKHNVRWLTFFRKSSAYFGLIKAILK